MVDRYGGGQEFSIVDNTTGDAADVVVDNSENSLRITGKVTIQPPGIPAGASQILMTIYTEVGTQNDDTYTITTGKTLVLQSIIGSSEWNNVGGAVIEVWYDPNGNGVGMSIIDVIHCNGNSANHSISNMYVGDGTKKIRMRRKVLGGGSLDIFGRIYGYEI